MLRIFHLAKKLKTAEHGIDTCIIIIHNICYQLKCVEKVRKKSCFSFAHIYLFSISFKK